MINRRGLLVGLGAVLAAPAIVHAGNLMPVRSIERLYRNRPPLMRLLDMHGNVIAEAPVTGNSEFRFPPFNCHADIFAIEHIDSRGANSSLQASGLPRTASQGDEIILSWFLHKPA